MSELRSRPPLERMLKIHQELQSGDYPNATTLASALEVSEKSIHRDLEFMRDRLQLPIEYDGSRFGYHYTQEVNTFPTMQISEGELFALLVADPAEFAYRICAGNFETGSGRSNQRDAAIGRVHGEMDMLDALSRYFDR